MNLFGVLVGTNSVMASVNTANSSIVFRYLMEFSLTLPQKIDVLLFMITQPSYR
jgi:hypothetical protein